MEVIVKYEGIAPHRATEGSGGVDVRSKDFHILGPRSAYKIKTGLKVGIPRGYVGLLVARSSLFSKYGLKLANSVGVIDSDYRNEIILNLENITDHDVKVSSGERLAQLIIVPCYMDAFVEADLDETVRGNGGFGSTGNE